MAQPRTELPHPAHSRLDEYETRKLVEACIDDQAGAADAVRAAAAQIAEAVTAAVPRLEAGGRIIYVGAGTSGRLGLLDSVELPPTFSWPPERAVALLAGGPIAIHRAVEGAEDDREQGALDLRAIGVTANDVVMLLAASGSTPFVLGALEGARAAGALTIGIANNPETPLLQAAAHPVLLVTGAEIIAGSTRMKAGTAQKIALNLFSTALMLRLGGVYEGRLVDMQVVNAKLQTRAIGMIRDIADVNEADAAAALCHADGKIKLAVLIALGWDAERGAAALSAAGGDLRAALAGTKT